MAILTADDIRDRVDALSDEGNFPDAQLDRLIAEFTEIAAEYRGVAYEPLDVTGETHHLRCERAFDLDHVLVSDVTITDPDGAELVADDDYTIDLATGHVVLAAHTTGDVSVDYTHGLDTAPESLLRACAQYVRACALSDGSSVQRDTISMQGPNGVTYRYSTPDVKAGRPTGWLEVDRLLNTLTSYKRPGFA